jgi:putative Mg2+ transporter-C (MgtC) family protein
MEFDISQLRILGLVALAMGLGALIGLERELADKPAGLRTHMMVAGAACLFVSLGDILVRHFDLELSHGLLRTDPIRVIEAVITGVSFLGAGTIIRGDSARKIEGLTTAASILLAAAVGVCAALAQFILAVGVAGLALITLRAIGFAEKKFRS